MKPTLLAVCFIFMVVGCCYAETKETSAEAELLFSLWAKFGNEQVNARPAKNFTEITPVNLGLTLNRIHNYDLQTRLVTVSGWLRIIWSDHRLTWVPEEYDGIKSISVRAKYFLWTPDIRLYNGVKAEMEADDMVKALVYPCGGVIWVVPVRFTVRCDPATKDKNPEEVSGGDSLPAQCTAVIGSWVYDSSQVAIRNPSIDVGRFYSDEWLTISEVSAQKNALTLDFVDKEYDTVAFSFSLGIGGFN